MFIRRFMADDLVKMATYFPVIALIGPRQSGKTTLAKEVFKNHKYLNLEEIDTRTFARTDPRGFLNEYRNDAGMIIDEFQHVPELLSYIQTQVDKEKKDGYFILTGSQNFLMNQAISQSLAGRISIHTLLPLSIAEISAAGLLPDEVEDVLYKGLYPSLYAKDVPADRWYDGYIKTHLERDVRQLKQVENISLFQTFVQLCAGRIGQLLNLTSLGNDCGISDKTAGQWLSLLEASYILYVIRPHYQNFSKRLIKTPKIYFYDPGLASALLGITQEQLSLHYLKGGLFESLIISDILKGYYNRGKVPRVYFWRDHTGNEVDCILEKGEELFPIEIKASKTISLSFFEGLDYWNSLASAPPENGFLVYGGDENQKRSRGNVVGWKFVDNILQDL